MRRFLPRLTLLCCWLAGVDAMASDLLNDKICGTTMSPRIVNGNEAQDGEFPWIVNLHSLTPDGIVRCAGSLITSRHVLTAGHCLEKEVTKITVSYASTKLKKAQEMPVKSLIRHKHFNTDTLENDVMVLLLAEDIKFNRYVRPICLPTPRLNPKHMAGMKATVAGWGTLYDPSEIKKTPGLNIHTEQMMRTSLTILNDTSCAELSEASAGKNLYIENLQICTFEKGTDTCVGDSGGPLFVRVKSRYFQVGVVSGGQECAGDHPGVYANVHYYIQWIMRVVNSLG